MGYTKDIEQELYFAKSIIDAINHVDMPILRYDGEKEVVKKALREYIDKLESKARYGY